MGAKRLGRLLMLSRRYMGMPACGHIHNTTQPLIKRLNLVGGLPVRLEFLGGAPIDHAMGEGSAVRK